MSEAGVSLEVLMEKIIDRGIEAAKLDYKSDPIKLAGAINGFEACRGKAPLKLIPIWQFSNKKAFYAREKESKNYWFWRCRAMEIDWVLNNVACFLGANGVPFPWQTTVRGYLNVSKILGLTKEKQDGHRHRQG